VEAGITIHLTDTSPQRNYKDEFPAKTKNEQFKTLAWNHSNAVIMYPEVTTIPNLPQ